MKGFTRVLGGQLLGPLLYVCAEKRRAGCPARATVRRQEEGDSVSHVLVDVSSPDRHSHDPIKASIYSDKLLVLMKTQIEMDPITPVGKKL